MKKALLPVKRRMRLRRAVKGLCIGLLLTAALAVGVLALSFFVPLAMRAHLMLAACGAIPVSVLTALVWPIRLTEAAKAADGCGLQERAQTALALVEADDPMSALQRKDAQQALKTLNVKRALPLQWMKKTLCAAAACVLVSAILFFVPNPQDDVLRAWEKFGREMEKPKEMLQEAAETLDETKMDEKTVRELRRILGDLARKMGEARNEREALSAVAEGQRQLERLLNENKNSAADALAQAGLEGVAEALSGTENELEAALSEMDMAELMEKLQAASGNATGAAQAALKNALQALSQGNISGAAQALSKLSANQLTAGQISAALQAARSMAAGQGMGGGFGQMGKQNGDGAGSGSTNEDMGAGSSAKGGGTGQTGPSYKLGTYEQIYDPTRLGNGGEVSQSAGEVREGDTAELTLAPSLGDASGYVPYDQVVGEYHENAVQRAQDAALPGYVQTWINSYFTLLTE